MMNKCTASAGCFDGHGSAPEQYRQHCPMRHVHGYSGSHWMPASGDYLLRIAPAFARQQTNKQQSTNTPTKLAVLMAIAMRRYNTAHIAQWRRSRASLEATGWHHRGSTCSDSINWTCQHRFFQCFSSSNCRKRQQNTKDTP
jgi:hypothetical protein